MNEQRQIIFLMLFLMMLFVSLFMFTDLFVDDDICPECEIDDKKEMTRRFSKLDSLRNNYFQDVRLLNL